MSLDILKQFVRDEERLYPKDGSFATKAKFLKVRTARKTEHRQHHKLIKLELVDHSDTQGIWYK